MIRLKSLTKMLGMGSALFISNFFCSQQDRQFPFVETAQYNANNPIEDRYSYCKLKSISGFTASVFDGHGGSLVAQYASKNLNQCIDDRIAKNKSLRLSTEALIQKSLTEAYKDIEDGFFAIFKENLDNKAYKKVGSCALTAVILKNSLHVGNAGDCQGVLLANKEAAMTNLRLNAGQQFEQARLIKQFPQQPDIFVCKSACYVKGRLQPTRSFGDFYLKYPQYNFTNLKVFTGPYISAVPLVTHFKLTDEHKNLILGTDGLWDEMGETEIHALFRAGRQKLGEKIFQKAIQLILERNKIKNFESLNEIPKRRNIHDDITLVNIRIDDLRKLL